MRDFPVVSRRHQSLWTGFITPLNVSIKRYCHPARLKWQAEEKFQLIDANHRLNIMKLLLLVLFIVTSQGEVLYEKCCMEGYAYVIGKCVEVPEEDTPWNYTAIFTDKLACNPRKTTQNTTKIPQDFRLPDFYFVDGGVFVTNYSLGLVDYEDFCLEYFATDDGFVLGMVGCFEPVKDEITVDYAGK